MSRNIHVTESLAKNGLPVLFKIIAENRRMGAFSIVPGYM